MIKQQKQPKALVLLSGGLDSTLAVKLLQEKGMDITAVNFHTYFCGGEKARIAGQNLNVPLREVDIISDFLKILKNPKYGRGSGINPCIDCHLLMLKHAKKIADKENFDFVATGEVLGQRPMSQNKQALDLIKEKSGLGKKLIRPLIDIGIKGRSRKEQIKLAKKFKIKNYPQPAGGCPLTQKDYAKKLEKLLEKKPCCKLRDIKLLEAGRNFWFGKSLIVVGRNHENNLQIKKLAQKGDILIELKDYMGPLTLVRGSSSKALDKAQELTQYYSTKARDKKNPSFRVEKI
ncbi:tRNA 4-thiouridine(8) synthase ThiI [bacterium]|nr:tRNA 4-thiouridine(8) synthase ThiI [bacterium]|tara:strand:+ start:14688 stop:15557 length:870 start_codon:yes stop_codon:yes gene_type:complete